MPAQAGNTLSNAKNRYADAKLLIYVMPSAAAFSSYFALSIPDDVAGATFKGFTAKDFYSSVYTGSVTALNIGEVTVHELGHGLDDILNPSSQSASTYFETYVGNDYLDLDYDTVGSSVATSHPRPPCKMGGPGNTITAPWFGITDQVTNVALCGTGTGYDSLSGLESIYVTNNTPWRNSKILQTIAPKVMKAIANGAYPDVYAQAYAIAVYLVSQRVPASDYYFPTIDGFITTNDYFGCSFGWTDLAYDNSTTPPENPLPLAPTNSTQGNCATPVPSWYLAVLGQ
jgi:hypothetical protein